MSEIERQIERDAARWRSEIEARHHSRDSANGSFRTWTDADNPTGRMPTRERRRTAVLACTAVLIGTLLVGLVFLIFVPRRHRDSEFATSSMPSGLASTQNVPPHSDKAPFRLELHLNTTRARANGQPIQGYVTVINQTGHRITISNACNGWLGVGLTTSHIKYDLRSGLVACASGHLAVGTSRVAVQVETTYAQCRQPGGTPPGDTNYPDCLSSEKQPLPPLPAANYQVKIRTMNLSQHPALPSPIMVTLASS